MADKKYKVIKNKLSNEVHICKLLGRERGSALQKGEVIEVDKSELEILKKQSWVKLNKEVK